MDFTDYLTGILEELNARGDYGIEDIKEIIRNADYSKVDEFGEISSFSNSATTLLYSGMMGNGVKSNDFVSTIEDVRIIDRSVAGKLLINDKLKLAVVEAIKNDILAGTFDPETVRKGFREPNGAEYIKFVDDLKNVNTETVHYVAIKAANAFDFEPAQGAWAIASEEFIKNTSPDSHILCVVSNADTNRTWGQVEVVTALEELPDSQKIEGTTVGELKKLVHNGETDVNSKYGDVWNELKNEAKVYDDILTRVGGDVADSGKLLTATNCDSLCVVKILDSTGNDVSGSVKLIEVSAGDVDGAIKVFEHTGKNVDIASAVLNKSKGNTHKALESIDEAQRTALVYLNDDGVEIGQSYKDTALENILPDKIPSDYKYSIRRSDLALLPPEASVSGKFPMYDKLSPADKIQIRDIERRRATGEISDKAEVVIGIDNNGRSKASLNVNGKVVPGALEPGTICIAMDMEGGKSVVCRDLEDENAKWKNQIEDLISDVKVKMINGVDRNQFRSVADALKKRGVTNPSKVIADAIGKIPSDNTDGMRFVTDIATGRNSISKILNFNIGDYEKTGEGIDVIKRWISDLDERNVPAKTVSERDVKNILTSLNMEIENNLSIKERQKALARATHKNIPVYALMGKGKRKGFTIEQIFHAEKYKTDGATDLPAPDDPKPYLLNHDKVVISIDSFESLKKDALEASELSKGIMTAQRKISEAEIKAKGIVTRANNKASGVEEEITRPQVKDNTPKVPAPKTQTGPGKTDISKKIQQSRSSAAKIDDKTKSPVQSVKNRNKGI